MKLAARPNIGEALGTPFVGTTNTSGFGQFVTVALRLFFVGGGILLIFLFIMGGLQIIIGAGNDKPSGLEQGKQTLTNAVVGFVIIIVAFWIVRILEEIVGVPFLSNPGI